MTKFLIIITIIERASNMNRITTKTVSSPTSCQKKLIVDLIIFFGGVGGNVHEEKLLIGVTNIWHPVSG